ncbi:hypothetical protein ACFVFJ_46235 [Streptomyces sp. NPDC057717]|uniref:hypothetical protein n=1 Tax=Streptomyces sp. NPDC057717 TaxID=3346224 RepID=UPI0036BD015D
MHGNHTRLAQHDHTITQRDTPQVTCTENEKNGEGSMTLGTAPRHGVLRSRNRLIGVVAISCTALALSACSDGSGDKDEAKPSASATPTKSVAPSTSSDPDESVKKEVLAVYSHFRAEQAKAYANGTIDGTKVQKYATAEAFGTVKVDLMSLQKAGNVGKGAPVTRAGVEDVRVNLTAKIPKATIKDCLDVSNWTVVNRKTGKTLPSPKGQLKRYVNDVSLEKWGKQWLVLTDTARSRAC